MKFEEAADGWMDKKAKEVSEVTASKYRQIIRNNLFLVFDKSKDVKNLVSRVPELEDLLQDKNYSEATAQRARQVCQRILTWGQLEAPKENDPDSLIQSLKKWAITTYD